MTSIAVRETATPEARSEPEPSNHLCARFGSFMFVPPEEVESEELVERLVEALNDDDRVVRVDRPRELDPRWNVRYGFFPPKPDRDGLIGFQVDTLEAVRFSEPLELVVHVLEKNQPRSGNDDLPSEDYYVVWDGFSVVVGWVPEDGQPWAYQSGGHVASEILRRAAKAAGGEFVVQACDPYCTHQFAHADLFLTPEDNRTVVECRKMDGPTRGSVELLVPAEPSDPAEMTRALWNVVSRSLASFTNMKNTARRILDLEQAVRDESDDLRALRVEVAQARSIPLWRWSGISERAALHAWTRKAELMVARIWRGIGLIEALTRVWADERLTYQQAAEYAGTTILFDWDERDNYEAIRSLDLRLIEGSVAEGASRLASVSLVRATVALSGSAVVGVLIGHFL